eukprot:2383098-Pleurochrysis_carterae.AAC.1
MKEKTATQHTTILDREASAARCIQRCWKTLQLDDVFYYKRYPARFAVLAEDGRMYDSRPLFEWLLVQAERHDFRGSLRLPTRKPVTALSFVLVVAGIARQSVIAIRSVLRGMKLMLFAYHIARDCISSASVVDYGMLALIKELHKTIVVRAILRGRMNDKDMLSFRRLCITAAMHSSSQQRQLQRKPFLSIFGENLFKRR